MSPSMHGSTTIHTPRKHIVPTHLNLPDQVLTLWTLGLSARQLLLLLVARTGLRDDEAAQAGFVPLTCETATWDHKVYYPGAHEVRIRLTGERETSRLQGAQMIGHVNAQVAKRVDISATAIFNQMRVENLNDLDLSYTSPLSSPWNPVQQSVQEWMRHP